jgi:PAS domain S-box-containing protein
MDSKSEQHIDLRNKAEGRLVHRPSTDRDPRSAEELLHELEVHQIELEMQNDELRRSQAALEESRDRYLDLFEFAPEGYLTLNSNGMIIEVNITGAALLSAERKNLLNCRFASLITHEDKDNWHRHFQSLLKSKGHQSYELELMRIDGSRFHAKLGCLLKKTDNASVVRIAIADISERKKLEQTQNRLIRSLKLLSEGGMLLIHARNEQKLLEEICRLAVETGGYLMAWVGFAENDPVKTIRPVAQSGYEEGYLDSIKVTWSDTELGQGPTGTAIRTKAVVVNQDCLHNPKMVPWREAALNRGYQSSIALPLVNNGYMLGAFTIYSADPYAFSDEEVALLEQLANELAFGIQTLRTRAEHDEALSALQQSEQRYHGMLADQTEVISRFKADHTMIYANDAFCRLFGKRSEDLIGYKWNPIVVQEDLPLIQEKLDSLSPTHPVVTVENRIIGGRGAIHWMQFVNRAFYDERGNLSEIQSVGRDITEQKKLGIALATNEKEFRSLAESMPQIVWITRADGWNIYSNKQWVNYTGLSLEESYGHGWNKPFHMDDQKRAWDAWQNAVNNHGTYSVECRLRRADGKYRWWLIRGVPVLDEAGNIAKWFGTCTDINDLKQSEQDLKVASITVQKILKENDQLSQEISRRNADLSALTAHVQQIGEKEKASLARELHDELGSTLVGLSMNVGRLLGKTSDPERMQDLAVIKELLSNAANIKQKVVSKLYPTVLDDCGFVAAVTWLVKEYKKHAEIEVELLLPKEELVMEHTFALAAYRITQECLTNIAKHAGASKVHIEAKNSDGFLDLTIQDNGNGLPDDIKTGGHGIFGMIERARYLGGSLKIESEDKKGTAAHLRLPLVVTKPKTRKRVLVVDDHSIVRDALRQLLNEQTDDFSVEGEAADGMAAVQMAVEGEWDIMLLDINLPKKNGIKVLEEIKALKPNLPIIMLSSHAKEEYGEIALSKGAACYLGKHETDNLVEAMRSSI